MPRRQRGPQCLSGAPRAGRAWWRWSTAPRDKAWLREVAPQIVAGCDFIIRERNRMKKTDVLGNKPAWHGLAPAGCVADPRDWEYSFMLNAYFYLGLKKSAKVLEDAGIKTGSVASELLGVSGRAMIEALAGGERDPRRLVALPVEGVVDHD